MATGAHPLLKRIGSALVLAPLVLFAVWEGMWFFWVMVLSAFAICLQESLFLSVRTRWPLVFAIGTVVYLTAAITSFVLLREMGPMPVFALLFAVWLTDIGGYAAGRTIGGPKLAPTISPNKTWAGLMGGILGSVISFAGFTFLTPGHEAWLSVIVIGIVIAIVSQIGDLVESFLKRQANAKDSGAIIPGHGGLLDRIDGLLLAAPVFLILLQGMM